jgi:hypothetical protein
LALLSVAVIFAFCLAGTTVIGLHNATSIEETQTVRNLVDRALATAVAATLTSNGTFGSNPAHDQVHVGSSGSAGTLAGSSPNTPSTSRLTGNTNTASADLSFASSDPNHPYGLNNLLGTAERKGWNLRQIPPEYDDLIAVGQCNGHPVVEEVMLHMPPVSFAVGASDKVLSTKGFTVGTVASAQRCHPIGALCCRPT